MNSNQSKKKQTITDPEILEELAAGQEPVQIQDLPVVDALPIQPQQQAVPKQQLASIDRDESDTRPGLAAYKPVIGNVNKSGGV